MITIIAIIRPVVITISIIIIIIIIIIIGLPGPRRALSGRRGPPGCLSRLRYMYVYIYINYYYYYYY